MTTVPDPWGCPTPAPCHVLQSANTCSCCLCGPGQDSHRTAELGVLRCPAPPPAPGEASWKWLGPATRREGGGAEAARANRHPGH